MSFLFLSCVIEVERGEQCCGRVTYAQSFYDSGEFSCHERMEWISVVTSFLLVVGKSERKEGSAKWPFLFLFLFFTAVSVTPFLSIAGVHRDYSFDRFSSFCIINP